MITHQPVESSNIASIGYDPEHETLEVAFRSGSVYSYAQVPAEVHAQLVSAPSVGEYFTRVIRSFPKQYPFTKVGDAALASPALAAGDAATLPALRITQVTQKRIFNLGNYESFAFEATALVDQAAGEDPAAVARALKDWIATQDPRASRPRQASLEEGPF